MTLNFWMMVCFKSLMFLCLSQCSSSRTLFLPRGWEITPEMQQLQNVDNGLWCNGKAQHMDQNRLQMCTVKLVDLRKIQGLNAKIISEGNVHTGGKWSQRWPGWHYTLYHLVICKFCISILFAFWRCLICVPVPGKSNVHGNQQPLQVQLKMCSVRLVDCRKLQTRKATADGEPEDGAYDHERDGNEFLSSSEYIMVALWLWMQIVIVVNLFGCKILQFLQKYKDWGIWRSRTWV